MDEETWLVNQNHEIFSFIGDSLEKAFTHLDQDDNYLVVQAFEAVGAACKVEDQVFFSNWADIQKDHEEMTPDVFRDKIKEMAQTPYQQRFSGPNGELLAEHDAVVPLIHKPAVLQTRAEAAATAKEAAERKPTRRAVAS
ncbi:hypothetical protein [Acanthopleuribacter pedis]|uniref:Uncharacterized protein n=1 Tax=Acanthopleuribacter pedis TaxID=442870 RepID=A0A8J7Q8D2_9BACT|nr:hypothetical protein [Acanthopleuribacter pedis]MBO1320341.1 hypothetical protein [Acanthopleuribacter pedis]